MDVAAYPDFQGTPYAANGWDGHKMTIYWMLNSHWPSFFGNIFDYYLRPGGAYYGARALGLAVDFATPWLARSRLRRMERQITQLVRQNALDHPIEGKK